MKYRLQDLIDMEHFQNLQDRLNEIYSFPSSIIDNDGNILTATAWQDVCTKFHRKNKDSERLCIKSDQYIQSHIHEANPAVSYRCPHGLVDNATPIIVDGIHYGNFFTGQFFLEKPDMDFFRAQAKKYGFDEDSYLEAVKRVPVWTQGQLNNYLFFIKGLISIITESALKKLKEVESRKQIEESASRHQSILQTAMDGFWLTDIKGQLLEVNNSYCSMSGYSEDELLAMRISDFEAIENPETVNTHMQKIIAKGSDRFESKHRRKDGTVFDVEVSVQFRNEGGGQCVAFLRDITERKQAEKALRDSEAFLKTLINAIPTPVFYKGRDGKYLGFNKAFEEFFGEPKERLIGKSVFDANPPELAEIYYSRDDELFHNGGVQRYESQWKDAHGKLRDFIFNKALFTDGKGNIGGLIGVLLDITDRKQAEKALIESEKKWRNILVNTPQMGIALDPTARIVFANEQFLKLTGWKEQEVIGQDWFDMFIPNESSEDIRDVFNETMRQKDALDFSNFENEILTKSGELLNVAWSNVVNKDA